MVWDRHGEGRIGDVPAANDGRARCARLLPSRGWPGAPAWWRRGSGAIGDVTAANDGRARCARLLPSRGWPGGGAQVRHMHQGGAPPRGWGGRERPASRHVTTRHRGGGGEQSTQLRQGVAGMSAGCLDPDQTLIRARLGGAQPGFNNWCARTRAKKHAAATSEAGVAKGCACHLTQACMRKGIGL